MQRPIAGVNSFMDWEMDEISDDCVVRRRSSKLQLLLPFCYPTRQRAGTDWNRAERLSEIL